jgi:hypothetical protein
VKANCAVIVYISDSQPGCRGTLGCCKEVSGVLPNFDLLLLIDVYVKILLSGSLQMGRDPVMKAGIFNVNVYLYFQYRFYLEITQFFTKKKILHNSKRRLT